MDKALNIICSITTAAVAMVALGVSVYQIRLSNKQHLFDRRINAYMYVMVLLDSCKENYDLLSPQEEYTIEKVFIFLTNNSCMEKYTDVVNNPLRSDLHVEFMGKCEEIQREAMEIRLVFKGDSAEKYASFLIAYENTLRSIHQYEIAYQGVVIDNVRCPERSQKDYLEKKMSLALDELKKAYDMATASDVEHRIQKQLSLI